MDETKEEVRFIDAEGYSGGGQDKISFREIVLQHLRRILSLTAVEFAGGYYQENTQLTRSGLAIKEKRYIPDSREVYGNAVDGLFDILFPHFDKIMKKDMEEFKTFKQKETERLQKEFGNKREVYKTQLIKNIKRKKFRLLNSFLYRTRYLEAQVFEDTI